MLHIDDLEPKPRCEKVLTHPASGAECRIIGSAHVSSASADEVRGVILREKPDVVVLELDAERLTGLLKSASSARPALKAAKRVQSLSDAVKVLFNGNLPIVVGSLGYATVGALLDSRPGSEFIAAVEAGQKVGATIVLGDRDQRATIGRLFARVQRGSKLFDAFVAGKEVIVDDEGVGSEEDVESISATVDDVHGAKGTAKMKKILERAGCESSEEVIKSSMEILRSALRSEPIRVDDLLKVRSCAQRVVEFVRVESFNGNPMFSPGSQVTTEKPNLMDWATAQTVIAERDLILATALQRDANAQKIIGVVGAGHISGITRAWNDVETSESRAKFNEYLENWPADAKPPDYTGKVITGLLGAAAITTILRRGSAGAVKFSGVLFGSMLTFGAVGVYFGANTLVTLGKVAVAIEDASIRAAELGQSKDQALPKSTFHNMIVRDATVPFKN